jgi:uncharacterized tellurite resistance protein B-like protein
MLSHLTKTLGNMLEKITAPKGGDESQDTASALDLSIKVMSLVSVADGKIDEAEVRQVQEAYLQHAGSMVEPTTIQRAFQIAADDQQAIWQELRAAKGLGEDIRINIFDAAAEIAMIDLHLHDDELNLLKKVGTVLGLPDEHVEEKLARAKAGE